MRAGKLDRSITIERQTETVLPTGAAVSAWSTIASVRAEVVQTTASEIATSYGEAQDGSLTFRVRYLLGITTADRVTYAGQAYDLKTVIEIGRRRSLELMAVARS
jgi:SPP1 family predicted phage head-tail adaptor